VSCPSRGRRALLPGGWSRRSRSPRARTWSAARRCVDHDVVALDVFERVDHRALLFFQFHHRYSCCAGCTRLPERDQVREVRAARRTCADFGPESSLASKGMVFTSPSMGTAGREKTTSSGELPDLIRVAPGVELCILIRAHEEIDLVCPQSPSGCRLSKPCASGASSRASIAKFGFAAIASFSIATRSMPERAERRGNADCRSA